MTSAQAVLGGISLGASEFKGPDSQLALEAFTIFRHVGRIARGMNTRHFGLPELDAVSTSPCRSGNNPTIRRTD